MKVGVSTASLFLRKNNEEALPLLNDLGVNCAEVFLTSYSEYGEPFASLLKQRQGNIAVNSVHILNTQFEPQLFNEHPRARADAFEWLGKTMDSANALGAPYYTFHGIARVKRASRSGERDNFPVLCEKFRDIADFCGKRNVTLCLENVEWASYNRPGFFGEIAKEVCNMRGVLDIKQARISGYPYEAYLTEMGARLAYAHISDIDGNGKICLPGKGTFDFDVLIKRLKDIGFDGALLIEVYTDDYGKETEIKIACDYVNELLYKYGVLS
ncbi:MAG: sugar phosphate isomerase/epimerase [Clostridia bacterium]|nr:sugar phosphate isomerase/epimerase [Clostridia bacterium]